MRREFTEPLPPQNGASPPALRPAPPIPRRNPRRSARSSRARLSASPAPDRSARLVPSRRLFRAPLCGAVPACARYEKSPQRNARHGLSQIFHGGRGGIRTPGGRKSSTVFKTAAFNRSATLPDCGHSAGESAECPAFLVAGQTSSGQGVCPDSFKFIAE